MQYVVCLLFYSLILTLTAATFKIGHVCSDSCSSIADLCALCNAYMVLMVWELETTGWKLVGQVWPIVAGGVC